MPELIELAKAALAQDDLEVRSIVQDLWRKKQALASIAKPNVNDPQILSMAAGLLELLAQQWGQAPPSWTKDIGAMPEPFFIPKFADVMEYVRFQCETESPEPLRKRNLFALPNYLKFM